MITIARRNWIKNSSSGEKIEHINDIWLENGDFAFCSGYECKRQTAEAVMKTLQGEIQTAMERGIPYFETVFTGRGMEEMWAEKARREILSLPFVMGIKSFTYKYDFRQKRFIYVLEMETTDNETVIVDTENGGQ